MYLGVNSLRFRSESIPMGIMSRGGICLPVTPELTKCMQKKIVSEYGNPCRPKETIEVILNEVLHIATLVQLCVTEDSKATLCECFGHFTFTLLIWCVNVHVHCASMGGTFYVQKPVYKSIWQFSNHQIPLWQSSWFHLKKKTNFNGVYCMGNDIDFCEHFEESVSFQWRIQDFP